jgi:hypothetical protein
METLMFEVNAYNLSNHLDLIPVGWLVICLFKVRNKVVLMGKFKRIHSKSFWETQEKISLVGVGTHRILILRSAV